MDTRRALAYIGVAIGPALYTPPGAYLQCAGLGLMLMAIILTIENRS